MMVAAPSCGCFYGCGGGDWFPVREVATAGCGCVCGNGDWFSVGVGLRSLIFFGYNVWSVGEERDDMKWDRWWGRERKRVKLIKNIE